MPFSPLFALERPRKEFLANAGVNPEDPCFRDVLPPLFEPQPENKPEYLSGSLRRYNFAAGFYA